MARKDTAVMLNIGATQQGIIKARETILAILKSGQDQATIQVALETLTKITNVNNTSVTNCNFTGGQ